MRGRVDAQGEIFYTVDLESRIPAGHPLRGIKRRVDEELRRLRPALDAAYARDGRPSIAPEQLIKATLLQALYSIRSERRLCEEIEYNWLYRWFLDLPPDERAWDHSTFSKNRLRFAEHGVMQKFFEGTVARAVQEEATSDEHFSVDGTLIQAWGSMKSFRPKNEDDDDADGPGDSNRWVDFHGERRGNATHESKTDPEARLMRKGPGQGAVLSHSMHVLMDNRHGLLMDVEVAEASGTAERAAAEAMIARVRKRHWLRPKTLAADKGYDDGWFLDRMGWKYGITPHVATRAGRIKDGGRAGQARRAARERMRALGYHLSQRARKRTEEIIGWMKQIAGLRKARFAGRWKIQWYAYAAGATYNLMRLVNLHGV
jgi:transposase